MNWRKMLEFSNSRVIIIGVRQQLPSAGLVGLLVFFSLAPFGASPNRHVCWLGGISRYIVGCVVGTLWRRPGEWDLILDSMWRGDAFGAAE